MWPATSLPISENGDLLFGHVLAATGVDLAQVGVIRHTYRATGLRGPGDLTAEKVLEYTRWQGFGKIPRKAPRVWLVFVTDGGRRSRFLWAYTNEGERPGAPRESPRVFDLQPSSFLAALQGRLVIEWSGDAINWFKSGATAAGFPVLEVADPAKVAFPGYDEMLIDYATLREVVEESRYAAWQAALSAVKGIYLIADTKHGKLYVGKADGERGILGRWTDYARDGHGGNVGLKELSWLDPTHPEHFEFSILRVFGTNTAPQEIDRAENHYKTALLTRRPHGYNHN